MRVQRSARRALLGGLYRTVSDVFCVCQIISGCGWGMIVSWASACYAFVICHPFAFRRRRKRLQDPLQNSSQRVQDVGQRCCSPAFHSQPYYSKGLSHRNRLAGGSQSISKFSREIEPTVSQFLNVHGKFIQPQSRVSIGLLPVSLCSITDN